MHPQKLCTLFLALIASAYVIDARTDYNEIDNASETYYTETFSAVRPFKNTIESQWQGIAPPGLAIYGWNVSSIGATYINVSKADIVTSKNVHYNKVLIF